MVKVLNRHKRYKYLCEICAKAHDTFVAAQLCQDVHVGEYDA